MIGFTLGYTVGAWQGLLIATPTGELPITEHNRILSSIRKLTSDLYSVNISTQKINTTISDDSKQSSRSNILNTSKVYSRSRSSGIRNVTRE